MGGSAGGSKGGSTADQRADQWAGSTADQRFDQWAGLHPALGDCALSGLSRVHDALEA